MVQMFVLLMIVLAFKILIFKLAQETETIREITPFHDVEANNPRGPSTSPSPVQQQRTSLHSQSSITQVDTTSDRRSHTLSPMKPPPVPLKFSPAPPPTLPPTPSSSTGHTDNRYSRIGTAPSSSQMSIDGVIPRTYRNREHIFHGKVCLVENLFACF